MGVLLGWERALTLCWLVYALETTNVWMDV